MILNTWSRIGTNFKCRNRCTTVVVSVWWVCVQNGETKESEQKTGKCVCVRERERDRNRWHATKHNKDKFKRTDLND